MTMCGWHSGSSSTFGPLQTRRPFGNGQRLALRVGRPLSATFAPHPQA